MKNQMNPILIVALLLLFSATLELCRAQAIEGADRIRDEVRIVAVHWRHRPFTPMPEFLVGSSRDPSTWSGWKIDTIIADPSWISEFDSTLSELRRGRVLVDFPSSPGLTPLRASIRRYGDGSSDTVAYGYSRTNGVWLNRRIHGNGGAHMALIESVLDARFRLEVDVSGWNRNVISYADLDTMSAAASEFQLGIGDPCRMALFYDSLANRLGRWRIAETDDSTLVIGDTNVLVHVVMYLDPPQWNLRWSWSDPRQRPTYTGTETNYGVDFVRETYRCKD